MLPPDTDHVDPADLPYDETIARLAQRLDEVRMGLQRYEEMQREMAQLQYEAGRLQEELEWWVRGRERYAPKLTELVPEMEVLKRIPKPTLNQALVRVISSAQPGKTEWRVSQILAQLRDLGWMPNGKSAEHVVRARLAQLARGENPSLRRVAQGVYALSESPNASIVPTEGSVTG